MPSVIVLGTAQDGGVPHAGCLCRNCSAARTDPAKRHPPVSIGIVSGDAAILIDPTSAIEEQTFMLWSHLPASKSHAEERFPPAQTVLVTHAHTGHYAGLWQFDRSVLAASGLAVFGPPLTAALLAANEPWIAIQHEGFIDIQPLAFDDPRTLLPGVSVELVQVPHRSEWQTDTAAVAISGTEKRLLYLPDIDSWDEWDRDLVATVEEYDLVLLDGCFWEAPPRKGVPHPPITLTMDLLQESADRGTVSIGFTHLNHSNPVLTPGSPERASVLERGFFVATEGDVYDL